MLRPLLAIALSSFLVPVVAQAQMTAAQTQMTTPDAAQRPPERRICRAMSEPGRLAGSRRVCLTRAEWEQMATDARRAGEEMASGRDSCALRAEGGTPIDATSMQQTQQSIARMSGC